jgi:hypothetical protein
MKKSMGLALGMAILLASNVSFAEEPKMTSISFEDDTIEGELMMPNSSQFTGMNVDELSSLIKAREDFVDEMRKTVDEL